jgi:tryptophan-rich sensory protein
MNPILAGIIAFIVSFGLPILVGATRKSYGQEWYRTLKKPRHMASDLTVNVVFLLFYILESVALYLILTLPEHAQILIYASWFIATALLSGLWSRLFFQYRRCDWALLALLCEVPLLWGLIFALYSSGHTAWNFLLPRAVWGIYAVTVNLQLCRLNKDFWKSHK